MLKFKKNQISKFISNHKMHVQFRMYCGVYGVRTLKFYIKKILHIDIPL